MNLLFSQINEPVELRINRINALIIENQKVYYQFATNLMHQINKDGEYGIVLSQDSAPLDISKKVEFITSFVPLDYNRKTMMSKLQNKMRECAMEDYYRESSELITLIHKFISDVSDSLPYDIEHDDIDVLQIFKMANSRFNFDESSLCSTLLDYFLNVISLEGDKLFVLLGFNQFVDDDEYRKFAESVVNHGVSLLLLENCGVCRSEFDSLTIIDTDLCVI